MVYCKLIEQKDNKAYYNIGGYGDDRTGIIVIDIDTGKYEITRQPLKSKVYDTHVRRLINRHLPEFRLGEFKEKFALEIG